MILASNHKFACAINCLDRNQLNESTPLMGDQNIATGLVHCEYGSAVFE